MIAEDLLIRTRDIHSHDLSEFVPAVKLRGDVPNALLIDTVHIYHESSLPCLQIYPATSGWNPSALPDWTMEFSADPNLATPTQYPKLMKPNSEGENIVVLSPESPLLKTLSAIFQPLEAYTTNLVVTWEPSQGPASSVPPYFNRSLKVSLPRYRLCFFVGAQGGLECKELPGMFVSPTQSIDTLLGLKNKLVLDPQDSNTTRKVILPEGDITVSFKPHLPELHPKVAISPCQDPGQQIRMFVYDVDELIGRLIGDGTVTSWYLLAYLHILTSSHLSDPLTHQTGVQQALVMLKSANAFAFTQLTTVDIRLLREIHTLTPVRIYYPKHLTSMEEVSWNTSLSPLSQSELFAPLVESILGYRSNQALFDLTPTNFTLEKKGSPTLRRRAELRTRRLVSNEVYETDSLNGKSELKRVNNLISHQNKFCRLLFLTGSLSGEVQL
jgi:hypothetical protein